MLVNLMALVMLGLSVEAQTYTKCADLPNVAVDYEKLVLVSPMKLLRSTDPTSNCSISVVTGPATLGGNTNYTFMSIQGNKVAYANSVVSPALSNPVYSCHDGSQTYYRNLHNNLTGDNPFLIGYVCGGNAVAVVNGYGRDEGVGPAIDAVINKYFSGMSGGENAVKTVWTDSCHATPYCGGFFN